MSKKNVTKSKPKVTNHGQMALKIMAGPASALPAAATSSEDWERYGAAMHPECPRELLEQLCEDRIGPIRKAAARHLRERQTLALVE